MTTKRLEPATVPSPQPQGTASAARYSNGTQAYELELRYAQVERERDMYRILAEERAKRLDRLVLVIEELRAQLVQLPAEVALRIKARLDAEASESDRS